ncbi:hypothetical protein BS47DRAFT_1373100 [Hydnum rufescens UP504]|uniref:ATP synthase subunit 4 n=1 Tax=Hydnum rufescens UP504 TaxID=1448309 RepID=A0A9P6ASH1_9AGAM|nr:hypothetical protein BS47DRAFT_1373100 [Hydnum rufescens UP504]
MRPTAGHTIRSANHPPAERANSLIAALPGNSLVSKTGIVVLGTGAIATAISQELYVATDETVLLIGSIAILSFIAKIIREPYKEWANGHITRIKDILEVTRTEHTGAVEDRIASVSEMKNVVDVTRNLFALSEAQFQDTAKLEAEAFALRQQVALAAELKSVLDSWARYEQQAKESEQAELTKTVIDRVVKTLKDEKMQRDILLGAVAEIEQLVKNKAI